MYTFKSKWSQLAAGLCFSVSLGAQDHVHGAGQLMIAQDGNTWFAHITVPAADVLGFEHAAKTTQQRDAIKALREKLKDSKNVVRFDGECSLTSYAIEMPEAGDDTHHDHGHNDDHQDAHHDADHDHNHHEHEHHDQEKGQNDYHGDVSVQYYFSCDKSVTQANVPLLTWASSITRLNTQWITEKGTSATSLNQENLIVTFQN